MRLFLPVCLLTAICTLPLSALAGSFWWGGISDGPFYPDGSAKGYMDLDVWWTSSKADKYDQYRFCWRKKSNTSNGRDPCLYNQIFNESDSAEFSALDKQIEASTTYKIRIRARKKTNGNWKTLTSTIVNPCIWANGVGFRNSCTSNPNE